MYASSSGWSCALTRICSALVKCLTTRSRRSMARTGSPAPTTSATAPPPRPARIAGALDTQKGRALTRLPVRQLDRLVDWRQRGWALAGAVSEIGAGPSPLWRRPAIETQSITLHHLDIDSHLGCRRRFIMRRRFWRRASRVRLNRIETVPNKIVPNPIRRRSQFMQAGPRYFG
jgi:hypothetical protein